MTRIHLISGREKALMRRHPWVFDGAIKEKNADIAAGETVLLCDSKDNPLAVGAWSPASQLRIRIWSFDPEEKIDKEFFRRRISAAVDYRKAPASSAGFEHGVPKINMLCRGLVAVLAAVVYFNAKDSIVVIYHFDKCFKGNVGVTRVIYGNTAAVLKLKLLENLTERVLPGRSCALCMSVPLCKAAERTKMYAAVKGIHLLGVRTAYNVIGTVREKTVNRIRRHRRQIAG